MRAVVCSAYGLPEVLKLVDVPTPAPIAGEVRVRVRATAVTSSDCYVRALDLNPRYRLLARLALGWKAPRQPILGMVLSGEIDAVGSGVTRFSEGDVVFGFDRQRKSASALKEAKLVLAPGGRRISVDDGIPKLVLDQLGLLAKLVVSGEVRPVIDRVHPLEGIVEAHRYVSRGRKQGIMRTLRLKRPDSSN